MSVEVNGYESSSKSSESAVSSEASVRLSELKKPQIKDGMQLIANRDIKELQVKKGMRFCVEDACQDSSEEDICVSIDGQQKWLSRKDFEKVSVQID